MENVDVAVGELDVCRHAGQGRAVQHGAQAVGRRSLFRITLGAAYPDLACSALAALVGLWPESGSSWAPVGP